MKKVLETKPDGRIVVRPLQKDEIELVLPDGRTVIGKVVGQKPEPAPTGFRILFAYGEKCLADPDIMTNHNLTILGIVAKAEQPFVGYFTEVLK